MIKVALKLELFVNVVSNVLLKAMSHINEAVTASAADNPGDAIKGNSVTIAEIFELPILANTLDTISRV